ncbi:MAG: hypothetical protein UT55_C0004G0021 [Candidatus Peregrinibacteria bacterium GW2011_GWE2_39_6]|nr:MAG: hypothetical protein UT36_C0004G0066 [Candidatus Peregrinibacteria bacterium GW2011_GWF2_39_17]KKR26657.1 MAG: hypothetical protein UT55_C0004G0021 [Candidatus Peregrinibacteria bacterium GW2011_GWE2_39_6]HCW32648.1 tRNA epoxyqueuosine(34) reductase QueG [Candidatus Peregrinibacteria bacterium]
MFDLISITPGNLDSEDFSRFEGWVAQGRAGEMTYLTCSVERRKSVEVLLPGVKTVICLGVNYFRENRERPNKGCFGQIARYAYGFDYHKIIEKKLKKKIRELREIYPQYEWKGYVDTGAILERAYAAKSKMGMIGKNTLFITPQYGSWVFLAEVLTTMPISEQEIKKLRKFFKGDISEKEENTQAGAGQTCGYCRLCLDICPTRALVAPYQLDARRCISYLTIEYRGSIPLSLRPLIGDWLFGCDLCQEICPQNNHAQAGNRDEIFGKRIGGDFQLLEDILKLKTKEEFDQRFALSPIRRARREGLVRNACIVAANVGAINLFSLLERIAHEDESAIVREHALWAVEKLATRLYSK